MDSCMFDREHLTARTIVFRALIKSYLRVCWVNAKMVKILGEIEKKLSKVSQNLALEPTECGF